MPDPISWSLVWPYYLAAALGGYLLGSVPFGLLLTRITGAGDLRKIGSGSIGATNVLRTGRKDLALATVVLDGGKGALAALVAANWGPDAMLIAAFFAVLGHNFPVWLKFRGGKGVATTLGTLAAVTWPVSFVACGVWLAVAGVFRISSLASLASLASAPFAMWFITGDWQRVQFAAALAVLAFIRHHENIRRLLAGREPKIGEKK
jgi:glycerol-3-phosphate acyltransferase PlsY